MFTTLIAKFPGTCPRCRQAFAAGTKIRYGGRNRAYHLSADCPANTHGGKTPQPDRDPGFVDLDRMVEDRNAEITAEYR